MDKQGASDDGRAKAELEQRQVSILPEKSESQPNYLQKWGPS